MKTTLTCLWVVVIACDTSVPPGSEADTAETLSPDAQPRDSDAALEAGDPVDAERVDTDPSDVAPTPNTSAFTGSFEFRPSLAFAVPTATGLELRFSAGHGSCDDFSEVVVRQDFALQVVLDAEGGAIEAGFERADADMFSPPNAGFTRVTWLVTALDSSVTAHRYRVLLSARTPTRLVGRLDADFVEQSFEPFAALSTGHLEGDFDVQICPPPAP